MGATGEERKGKDGGPEKSTEQKDKYQEITGDKVRALWLSENSEFICTNAECGYAETRAVNYKNKIRDHTGKVTGYIYISHACARAFYLLRTDRTGAVNLLDA